MFALGNRNTGKSLRGKRDATGHCKVKNQGSVQIMSDFHVSLKLSRAEREERDFCLTLPFSLLPCKSYVPSEASYSARAFWAPWEDRGSIV